MFPLFVRFYKMPDIWLVLQNAPSNHLLINVEKTNFWKYIYFGYMFSFGRVGISYNQNWLKI